MAAQCCSEKNHVGKIFIGMNTSHFVAIYAVREALNIDAGAGLNVVDPYALNKLPQNCRRFTAQELRAATEGFSEDLVIGEGGFGKVNDCCVPFRHNIHTRALYVIRVVGRALVASS